MILKELFERFFIIHKCGGCREILDHEDFSEALCPECRLKWRVAKTESCPVCAQSAVECTCMPKTLAKTGALCLRKLNFYHAYRDKEPQNRLIYFLKPAHPKVECPVFPVKVYQEVPLFSDRR